jgi:hypothetical protein
MQVSATATGLANKLFTPDFGQIMGTPSFNTIPQELLHLDTVSRD